MQLNPDQPLRPQLVDLSSTKLEHLVAAGFAQLGYFILQDIHLQIGNDSVAQIDVFASLQTPFHESRLVFECKGGNPTYNEIHKFASLALGLLKPKPDECTIVCRPNTDENRKRVAETLGVRILERDNLVNLMLPLLQGVHVRPERICGLNRWLAVWTAHKYLTDTISQNDRLKAHYRFISRELWWLEDPVLQVQTSFDKAQTTFNQTTNHVATQCNTTAQRYIRSRAANNDLIEAAMYCELLHRMVNMYAVVRVAIEVQRQHGHDYLVNNIGANLRAAISEITAHPRTLYNFAGFFQHWLLIWGGIIRCEHQEAEYQKMADEFSTTPTTIKHYLDVIELIYTGSSSTSSLLYKGPSVIFFKWVPAQFRAMGILHRYANGLMTDDDRIFKGNTDANNIASLDRALDAIGGVVNLRFTPNM